MDAYKELPTEDKDYFEYSKDFGSGFSVHKTHNDRKRKRVLHTLDSLISILLVAPLNVAVWRGIWTILIIYYEYFPPAEFFCFSITIHVFLTICQDGLYNILNTIGQKGFICRIIVMILVKIYTYIFLFTIILNWATLWLMFDDVFEIEFSIGGRVLPQGRYVEGIVFCVGCVTVLILLKTLKNIAGPPFVIAMDYLEEMIRFPTYFKTKAGDKTSLYILDCLFSVLVVGTLVVFVWRGAWVLIDIFLFPEDEKLSAWGSLILGYITVAIAFLMQPMMRWICDRATGASRLFVADFFILFAFFGTVNVWRGIWNLLNLYFLPDNLELSCWITHWVCLVILVLLGCSNSLLVRGVYIDAEEPAGKCVVFPCYYLRVIFQQEKMKNKNATIPMQEKIKPTQDSEKKIYENNHIINVSTIESNIENHAKS